MSRYLCPECQSDSNVVETRPSYNRLRRRRLCQAHKHRFSTVEVPIDAPEKIVTLIAFGLSNILQEDGTVDIQMFEDMQAYMRSQSREILLGLSEEPAPYGS
jgi:hypothetical protein